MRTYVVQPGDTPASIAARDEMAGCPKCAIDLTRVNAKPIVRYPNGYRTFRELRAGEVLNVPSKWSSEFFNNSSHEYFAALPHPNGVSMGVGSLGGISELDAASDQVIGLAQKDDHDFADAADAASFAIDRAVRGVDGDADPRVAAVAAATHISTNSARQRSVDFRAALAAGDTEDLTRQRLGVQNDLLTAIDTAQIALQAIHATPIPTPILIPTPKPKPPTPVPAPPPMAPISSTPRKISTGSLLGLGLLGAGLVGGAIYWTLYPETVKRWL